MKVIDVHTHVQFAAYDDDREAVIMRARDKGVGMVMVGTQKTTSENAVKLGKKYPGLVWATVGLHPIHTEKSYHDTQELGGGEAAQAFTSRGEEFDYEFYKNLAEQKEVVAIGECGLDYYRLEETTKENQKAVFLEHIRLAGEVNKALMIHCRPSKGTDNAYEDLLQIFKSDVAVSIPRIIHFYVGSIEMTKQFVAAGFYFTFGGVITFARDYDESISHIPMNRILLETDAPYVTPSPHRGKRNEPAFILETAQKLAELKGVSYDEVLLTTTKTAKNVFGIKI